MKPRIKEVIVVEGKTDTAKLQSLFDVTTIETNGSHLSNKTITLIKQVADKQGVILFLDPDGPGEQTRRKIENVLDKFKSAFVFRKSMGNSKKIGIAEADDKAIIKAIKQAATFDKTLDSLSWHEYLSLNWNTKAKRKIITDSLSISECNNKQLFKRLNMLGYTLNDIKKEYVKVMGSM